MLAMSPADGLGQGGPVGRDHPHDVEMHIVAAGWAPAAKVSIVGPARMEVFDRVIEPIEHETIAPARRG